jgi:zinc protease
MSTRFARHRRSAPPAVAAPLATLLLALGLSLCGAAPAAAQVANVDQLRYPPLPAFDIPQPRRVVLPNGMVVMLVEDHELPLVDGVALIHTGARLEPADKAGLAELTGEVLRSGGTATMSGDALDDYLEGKAASIETSIDDDLGQASLSCLKGDFPAVLKVFAEVLRHPAFAADRLEVARTGALAAIARQNDEPHQVLFRELTKLVYGAGSPYARTPTYATVGGITRDDLLAWHARYFHPERIALGLVGDFDADRALALIREAFGDWPRGPAVDDPEPAYRTTPLPGLWFVEKDDMTQAAIALGELGIRRDAPDFYAVEVLNDVLSGSFTSRLVSEIRTAKGLAYAVAGGVGADFDHAGMTVLWMTTKTATTGAGLGALLDEARDLTRRPPTGEEVERAKTAILNSFIFNVDSADKILAQQLHYEHFGYPLDRMERYRQGVEKVSVEQVRQAAVDDVHPDRLAILVVGPAAARAQLAPFGPVHDLDVSIPEP